MASSGGKSAFSRLMAELGVDDDLAVHVVSLGYDDGPTLCFAFVNAEAFVTFLQPFLDDTCWSSPLWAATSPAGPRPDHRCPAPAAAGGLDGGPLGMACHSSPMLLGCLCLLVAWTCPALAGQASALRVSTPVSSRRWLLCGCRTRLSRSSFE